LNPNEDTPLSPVPPPRTTPFMTPCAYILVGSVAFFFFLFFFF
jgi:hypothetical protein